MSKIIHALRQGDRKLAYRLLQRASSYEISLSDRQGQTALHIAVQKNYLEIVKALLEKKAAINTQGSCPSYTFMTPLHYAAVTGNLQATKMLLAYGANTQLKNGQLHTAATLAYQHGFAQVARTIQYHEIQQSPYYCKQDPLLEQNLARKLLELKNSTIEALQARTWLCQRSKGQDNIVDLLAYKQQKKAKK